MKIDQKQELVVQFNEMKKNGENYEVTIKCPHCGREHEYSSILMATQFRINCLCLHELNCMTTKYANKLISQSSKSTIYAES